MKVMYSLLQVYQKRFKFGYINWVLKIDIKIDYPFNAQLRNVIFSLVIVIFNIEFGY